MPEPCGCRTAWVGEDITIPSVADVVHCPMHAAAKDMLAALEKIRDGLDELLTSEDIPLHDAAAPVWLDAQDRLLPQLADTARKAAARGGGA